VIRGGKAHARCRRCRLAGERRAPPLPGKGAGSELALATATSYSRPLIGGPDGSGKLVDSELV